MTAVALVLHPMGMFIEDPAIEVDRFVIPLTEPMDISFERIRAGEHAPIDQQKVDAGGGEALCAGRVV